MRLKYFIIQFIVIFPLFSQSSSTSVIDSMLTESFQKFIQLQFIESSNLADEALELSILKNYSKGKVMSTIYIAKVLVEIGLNEEALKYIQSIYEEPYFRKEAIPQVESHRLKGRIYGNQQLFTLAKAEFNKQLSLSEKITDQKKKEFSKLLAYQNIEHLYSLQSVNDSVEVYQNLQEEQLSHFEEHEAFYNISTLYSNRGRLLLNNNKFDSAAVELQKSIDILEKYNIPYKFYSLQIFGDLEAARGNIDKAISYYNEALENSTSLGAIYTSRELHETLAKYLIANDTLTDKARKHGREYTILNDSLEYQNSMLVNTIFENIIKDKDKASAQKIIIFWHILASLILISILVVALLIIRNRKKKKKLIEKEQALVSRKEKIELLEEELENNIFNDIIELAKSNSPEFLPLFGEGYPEFVEAMKQLDPNIRSSELYFSALAYLNFTTKDIANFTFVTVRAVQVRRNRMRKKYDIPSDVDFNEWFRNLENGDIFVDEEVTG